jgi:tetratricopeptide (TPR) repeat protein/predicted Ser/Thr protein kinase
MNDDSTIDLGRSGDATRAWTSKEEEVKHYSRAFVGEILGGYRIEKEIGHGSMGIVFLAIHVDDGRKAAVKILPPSLSVTVTVIKRFLREAESVARLDHEGIVRIYSVGEERGIHFYAMQFVEGASLDKLVKQRRFSVRECATIIAEAARALFLAHEAQIIHRDIKPANILLTLKDRPVLTDFGLAKPEKAATLTESGALVGTPIYMSPEQVRADKTLIDRRTDIYSLGISMYEMLSGVTPFEGSSTQEILQKIENTEPIALRKMRPDVPRDIETICHKAIEKDPARRYQTAIELALDLERFLRSEPIQARPPSIASRVLRKVRKHPTVAGLTLALTVTIGVVAVQGVLNRTQQIETQDMLRGEQYKQLLASAAAERASTGPSSAIIILSQAIGTFPNRVEAFVERGVCYYEMNSYEKAVADFDAALAIKADYHRAKLWRGVAKCRDGTRDEQDAGLRDLEETRNVIVDDPECVFLSAKQSLIFAQDRGASPSTRDTFLNIVDVRVQQLLKQIPEREEAARAAGESLRLKWRLDDVLVLQGMLYEEQNDLEAARANYRRALEIDPSNDEARALLRERKVEPDALSSADPAQVLRRGAPGWITALATEGLSWANSALQADPDFLRRAADALNVYRDDDAPNSTSGSRPAAESQEALDSELVRADALWRSGDERGAAAIYERVLEKLPTVDACCRLAEHHLKQPDGLSDAVRYSEAALRLNATNPYALSVAVRVFAKVGDEKRLRELAVQLSTHHPSLLEKSEIREVLQPFLDVEVVKPAGGAKPNDGS